MECLFELAAIGFFKDKNRILNVDNKFYSGVQYDQFLEEIIKVKLISENKNKNQCICFLIFSSLIFSHLVSQERAVK